MADTPETRVHVALDDLKPRGSVKKKPPKGSKPPVRRIVEGKEIACASEATYNCTFSLLLSMYLLRKCLFGNYMYVYFGNYMYGFFLNQKIVVYFCLFFC